MKILRAMIILLIPFIFTMCGQAVDLSGKDINEFIPDVGGGGDVDNNNNNVVGVSGYSALVETTPFAAGAQGANCATTGGVRVQWGLDNGDGGGIAGDFILEVGEIDKTEYICNGAAGVAGPAGPSGPGHNSLIDSFDFPAGGDCPLTGGVEIDSGLDNGDGGGTADNGILEAGEVDKSEYVCHGLAGADGADGVNGINGVNGFSTLISTFSFIAGGEGVNCQFTGGVKISYGLDNGDGGGIAGNNIFEAGELDSVEYVCNGAAGANGSDGATGPTGSDGADGADGADGTSATVVVETSGANCTYGGIKVTDAFGDTYVCNGADGTSVAVAVELPGGNCIYGGIKVTDASGDTYVCDGAPGADGADGTSVVVIPEAAGLNCTYGGIKVTDALGDTYVCDGAPGTDGTDGTSVIVTPEGAGANCTYGGIKVTDALGDHYICNGSDGADGTSVIVTPEAAGANCTYGGIKVTDALGDTYVCNGAPGADGADGSDGADGTSVTVAAEVPGVNCTYGGIKVTDAIGDHYVCNGAPGVDGTSVAVAVEAPGANCTYGGVKVTDAVSDKYVCNGAPGADGADGSDGADGTSVIVTPEGAGANCTYGGIKVTDALGDTYVCNGAPGADGADGATGATGATGPSYGALVTTAAEASGVNCAYGGHKIQTGLDNGDGGGTADNTLLEAGEIDSTAYICAAGGRILYVNTNDITGVAGTGEQTLGSYTLPANTLAVNNSCIEIDTLVSVTGAGNTTIRVRFGAGAPATLVYQSTTAAMSGDNIRILVKIYRTSATTQRAIATATDQTNVNLVRAYYATASETLANALPIYVTGQNANTGIRYTERTFEVRYCGAPI